jgi:hypothetical protein
VEEKEYEKKVEECEGRGEEEGKEEV